MVTGHKWKISVCKNLYSEIHISWLYNELALDTVNVRSAPQSHFQTQRKSMHAAWKLTQF